MIKHQCSKVTFSNEKFALEYLIKLKKTSTRDRKPANAYLCEKCFCWHLTSIEPKESSHVKNLNRQIVNLKNKISFLEIQLEQLKTKK